MLGDHIECLSCQHIYVHIIDISYVIPTLLLLTQQTHACSHPPMHRHEHTETDRHTNYIKPFGAEGNGSAVTKFAGVLQSPLPDSLLQHTLNV